MKTCFNTITAGPAVEFEEVMRSCTDAGFEGVEVEVGCLDRYLVGHTLAEARALLTGGGLRLASLMAFSLEVFGDPEPQVAEVRRAAQLCAELGGDTLLVFCAAGVPEGTSHADAIARAGERAALYAEAAAPARIALEPIGGTALMPGPDEALAVARASGHDNVGIMMDTFHYHLSGVTLDRVRNLPVDDLLIVHVNDCEDLPRDQLTDGHRLMPGLGILPLVDVFQALAGLGYGGYLSLEIFRQEYWDWPVARTVSTAAKTLREQMQLAGLPLLPR